MATAGLVNKGTTFSWCHHAVAIGRQQRCESWSVHGCGVATKWLHDKMVILFVNFLFCYICQHIVANANYAINAFTFCCDQLKQYNSLFSGVTCEWTITPTFKYGDTTTLWLHLGFEWVCCGSLYTSCHSSTLSACVIVIMPSTWAPLLLGLSDSAESVLFAQSTKHQWLCHVARLLPHNQVNPLWTLTWVMASDERRRKWFLSKFSH